MQKCNKQQRTTATPDDCIKKTKRKTNFAKIIVSGTAEKPYYEIMWFDYMDRQCNVGYGSYNLSFVFRWLSECFEIEDAPQVDVVEVVRCKDCTWWKDFMCTNVNGADCLVMNENWFCASGERREGE